MLFWRGELMVRERSGFERVYDLSERVLPAGTDTRMPAPDELGRFVVRRAIAALGVANEKEIRDYIRIGDRHVIAGAIRELLAAAEIVRLVVEEQGGTVYALPALLEKVSRFRASPPCVHLLSPFDNLAISRSRVKERFGFDFKFECYLPKEKRNHGYFVLPILFGEDIVGRLDPKADRQNKTFLVRRLLLEPGVDSEALLPELGRAIHDLARFNGCERIVLENVRPSKLLAPLKRALTPGKEK